MITFDCRVISVFVVEIGVWCRDCTIVLLLIVFLVIKSNSAGWQGTINLFLASSGAKKYAQHEYNGWLFVWTTFCCRNRVLVPAMVEVTFSRVQKRREKRAEAASNERLKISTSFFRMLLRARFQASRVRPATKIYHKIMSIWPLLATNISKESSFSHQKHIKRTQNWHFRGHYASGLVWFQPVLN